LTERKSQGNIVCFRNLQEATDEAITLFSDINAKEEIFLPAYEQIVLKFKEHHKSLINIAFLPEDVKDLKGEEDELKFVQAFRRLMRVKNMLVTYLEFEWADLSMTEELFTSFSEQYLTIKDKVKRQSTDGTDKASVLDDIDFELDILRTDIINVSYILKLLAKIKPEDKVAAAQQKKQILDMLAGDVKLRSKRELIEKFIEENLPHISDLNKIDNEFEQYWQDQKVLALAKLCEDENLDQAQFNALIDAYIYSGQDPIKDDVLKCLDNRPSILQARHIGDRIIEKMKHFVEVFIQGMSA
jgi:type I restriction enzyme R subunit